MFYPGLIDTALYREKLQTCVCSEPPAPAESVPRSRNIAETGLVDHDAASMVHAAAED